MLRMMRGSSDEAPEIETSGNIGRTQPLSNHKRAFIVELAAGCRAIYDDAIIFASLTNVSPEFLCRSVTKLKALAYNTSKIGAISIYCK